MRSASTCKSRPRLWARCGLLLLLCLGQQAPAAFLFTGCGVVRFFSPPSPETQTILNQNKLTLAPELNLRHGPSFKYPGTSLMRDNSYMKEGYVDVSNSEAIEDAVKILGRGSAELEAAVRQRIAAARLKGANEVPLSELLDPAIRAGLGRFVDCDGPNCFNTAARFNMPEIPQRETDPQEKIKLLQKDFVQLKPGDKLQYGDEIVIWMPPSDPKEAPYDVSKIDPDSPLWQGRILHSAVFIDSRTLYQKGSDLKDSPVGLEDIGSALRIYQTWGPVITVHRRKAAPVVPVTAPARPRLIVGR